MADELTRPKDDGKNMNQDQITKACHSAFLSRLPDHAPEIIAGQGSTQTALYGLL